MELAGKVLVVTGAGGGIGREVALQLLRQGARVVAVDLRAEGLEETARLASVPADRLVTHAVDVSDVAQVDALAARLTAEGHVDGLLNVAGVIQRFTPFEQLSRAEVQRVLDVNLWGPIDLVRALLPHLRSRPEAAVVNVSSMGALVPVPGQTAYGASKAGLKLLTEGLQAELRGTRVAVTLVVPGGVATGIADNSGAARPGRDAGSASHRLTTAADAARQIVSGVERGSRRVLIGRDARLLDRLSRLMPVRTVDLVAARMASLLEG